MSAALSPRRSKLHERLNARPPLDAFKWAATSFEAFALEAFRALQEAEPDPIADAERVAVQTEEAVPMSCAAEDWVEVDAWLYGADARLR